jgi:hypothetical protein
MRTHKKNITGCNKFTRAPIEYGAREQGIGEVA